MLYKNSESAYSLHNQTEKHSPEELTLFNQGAYFT